MKCFAMLCHGDFNTDAIINDAVLTIFAEDFRIGMKSDLCPAPITDFTDIFDATESYAA